MPLRTGRVDPPRKYHLSPAPARADPPEACGNSLRSPGAGSPCVPRGRRRRHGRPIATAIAPDVHGLPLALLGRRSRPARRAGTGGRTRRPARLPAAVSDPAFACRGHPCERGRTRSGGPPLLAQTVGWWSLSRRASLYLAAAQPARSFLRWRCRGDDASCPWLHHRASKAEAWPSPLPQGTVATGRQARSCRRPSPGSSQPSDRRAQLRTWLWASFSSSWRAIPASRPSMPRLATISRNSPLLVMSRLTPSATTSMIRKRPLLCRTRQSTR